MIAARKCSTRRIGDAVLRFKRKASQLMPAGWLEQAIPEVHTLLDLAFARGESAGHQTKRLHRLVEEHGVHTVREAVVEALRRNTPTAASVAFLLRTRNRSQAMPVDLSRHPEVQSLLVRPHALDRYDTLTQDTLTQDSLHNPEEDSDEDPIHPAGPTTDGDETGQ